MSILSRIIGGEVSTNQVVNIQNRQLDYLTENDYAVQVHSSEHVEIQEKVAEIIEDLFKGDKRLKKGLAGIAWSNDGGMQYLIVDLEKVGEIEAFLQNRKIQVNDTIYRIYLEHGYKAEGTPNYPDYSKVKVFEIELFRKGRK